jgi:hypothetical protein
MGYQGIPEQDVYDVLADVEKRFPIDQDRVYLTGLSMGGGGTLWIGLTHPDIWAAIAPVCPAPPPGTEAVAANALNLPVHFFQGGADPLVKPEGTRAWAQRLKDLGTKVEYVEYPGVKHNSWENAYRDEAIFAWFAQFRRNRYPDRVRFTASQYRYSAAYWIRIDQLTPGLLANIDAKFTAPNRIEITASGLEALTLQLSGHPKFNAGRPVRISVNGETLTASAADSLSLVRQNGAWGAAKNRPLDAKHIGAEGPMPEAIASRHIYVYGTADDPSPDELHARREQANRAADWSPPSRRVAVYPRVVADKDVRPSDFESSNLILLGTRETNSVIAKFSERLPIQLDASASGYGLAYIFPIGSHYVLVNSGLPWWTESSAVNSAPRGGFSFVAGPAGALMKISDDYILFRGSAGNPIAEGRFDNDWRLPAADAGKMKATGVVRLANPTGGALSRTNN